MPTTTTTTYADDAAAHAARLHTRTRESGRREVAAATARDARTNTAPITPDALAARIRAAVGYALPNLTPHAAQDLAQEVHLSVFRRFDTWQPRDCDVSRKWLALRAVSLWRDARTRVADTLDAESMDAESTDTDTGDVSTRYDFHAAALGEHLPAAACDTDTVAAALDVAPRTPAWDALNAALSGWKTTADVAAAYAITEGSARVRLTNGRKQLRARFTPDALVAAILDADAGELPIAAAPVVADSRPRWHCPLSGEWSDDRAPSPWSRIRPRNGARVTDDRLRLRADARALRAVLDTLGLTTACAPHTAALAPQDRDDARAVHAPTTHPGSARSVLRYIAAAERATEAG